MPISEALLDGAELVAGRYRLEKILGMGGMGCVMSATDLEPGRHDRRVAVKFMLPDAMKSPSLHRRFVREVEAIGRLRSEHVCRLLDAGRLPGGAPFMVMEHLEGSDLERLILERGALSLSEAADSILQILDAIAEAHSHGIIHRDLKPANVFRALLEDGRPIIKVLDFGVAKAADGLHSTATDTVMGSPAFMAPEQLVSSKRVDERADVYSIGSIFYFLLTGRPPFDAEQLPALCLKVLNEDPVPPSAFRDDLHPEVDEVVLTCIAREAENRYPNAAELAFAVSQFTSERFRPLAENAFRALDCTPTKMWRRRRARPLTAATLNERKERGSDNKATVMVRLSGDGSTIRRRGRRRLWLLVIVSAIGVAFGAVAAVMLAERHRASPPTAARSPEPARSQTMAPTTDPAPAPPPTTPAVPSTRDAVVPMAAEGAASVPAAAEEAANVPAAAEEPPEPVKRRRTRPRRAKNAPRGQEPSTESRAEKPVTETPPPAGPTKPACASDDPLCAFGTAR